MALAEAGIKAPNLANPAHLWAIHRQLKPYVAWKLRQLLPARSSALPKLPAPLAGHAHFAAKTLRRCRREIDGMMNKHQLRLADRQCAMAQQSKRVQDAVVMLVTALWAGRRKNEIVHQAADVICQDLRRALTGAKPSNSYYRTATALGERIAEDGFEAIAGIEADEILMPYS